MRFEVRGVYGGRAEGRLVVSPEPVSFLGGVDPESGRVRERSHPLEGVDISGKLLVLPRSKGSTVGCYVLYAMRKRGTAPAGIVCTEADELLVSGAVISELPLAVCSPRVLEELLVSMGRRGVLEPELGYLEVLE